MMKQHNTKPYSEHQEISQLLPWYANKTLQGSELKDVEAHLGACLTCKRELMQLQKLAQVVIQEGVLDSAEQASFTRLKMRLHAQSQALPQQARPDEYQNTLPDNVKQLSVPKKQRWVNSSIARSTLAMAATVLLSIGLLMPRHVENEMRLGSNFRTLSGSQQEALGKNDIRVVFAENIDQQQKNQILESVQGQVIDSPTAQGVYTVRLNKDLAAEQLLAVVDLLRKDSNIVFAEPAYALLSSMHMEK